MRASAPSLSRRTCLRVRYLAAPARGRPRAYGPPAMRRQGGAVLFDVEYCHPRWPQIALHDRGGGTFMRATSLVAEVACWQRAQDARLPRDLNR
jgi:hypothetical protein